MNGVLEWLLLTLLLTAAFLVFLLWRTPYFITRTVIRGLGRRLGGPPWNRFLIGGVPTSGVDRVVRTSPDVIYMFGAFDASRGPVLVRCAVPDDGTYWCISAYAKNTDNFYCRDDRGARNRDFDLVIAGRRGEYAKRGDEEVVRAPGARGVIIVRAVIKNREDAEEAARIQELLKRTTIAPCSQAQHAAPVLARRGRQVP